MQMRWLVLQVPLWAKEVRKEAIYQGWPSRKIGT